MALSFTLGFNPKWYIADLEGRPLGGGYLATFSSLNHQVLNPVFTDGSGLTTWPYVTIPNVGSLGILFDENGTQGPFYFQFNPAVPTQLYYLEVYDADGVLQWTIDNYIPSGAGGGGTITIAYNITNIIPNNIMLRNVIGATPVSTAQFLKVAPGAHSGLAKTVSNAGPDIVFLKNNLAATDTLNFALFGRGETFPNGEPTPIDYLHYVSNAAAGELQKCVQFPITHGVQNIQNQAATLSIFARCTSGANTITLNWLQFFGDGASASTPVITPIQTLTLSNVWQKFAVTANVPSITGKNLGECGNDGLFLQVQYPLTLATVIDFTKPSVYMGNIVPGTDFSPNDVIESVMYNPRTGYVTQGFDAEVMGGWVLMNDGTIGSASSGATTRANIDTFPLYNMLYTNVIDTWAPVSGGRTGDAVADFVSGKTITLTRALGRVLGQYGTGAGLTARVLGQFLGAEKHTIASVELPVTVPVGSSAAFNTSSVAAGAFAEVPGGNAGFIWGQGGGIAQADNIMQPSTFAATFIKL